MGDIPTAGQLTLLIAAILVLIAGGVATLRRRRMESRQVDDARLETLRIFSKAALYVGTLFVIGVLVWHCCVRSSWQPLEDNFGAFLCLGILLSTFVIYTQRAHPLRGLDLFIMPVVLLMLIMAAVFGKTLPRQYREQTWTMVHYFSTFLGFVAFAVAGAVGAMYLISNRRLRQKASHPAVDLEASNALKISRGYPSRLVLPFCRSGLITGFALLKFGPNGLGAMWYRNPKVALTCAAWVVYALVLHAPINPSFRGRRTAALSVLGLVLMVGVLVTVQFMK